MSKRSPMVKPVLLPRFEPYRAPSANEHRRAEASPFHPHLPGHYRDQWRLLIPRLGAAGTLAQARTVVDREMADLAELPEALDPEGRERYRAVLLLLRDLTHHGWMPRQGPGGLYVYPPQMEGDDILEEKARLRASFRIARAEKLRLEEESAFIRRMESPRPWKGAEVSVLSLIADGAELARTLGDVRDLAEPERSAALRESVRPYLQLVPRSDAPTARQQDPHTGLRLLDIWSYFRWMWSTPHEQGPIREMFYLIRDAARPFHPVMGIAALGNTAAEIPARDDYLGWTRDAIQFAFKRRPEEWHSRTVDLPHPRVAGGVAANVWRVHSAQHESDDLYRERIAQHARDFAQMLKASASATLSEMFLDDLPVTPDELEHPTEDTIRRLREVELEVTHEVRRDQKENPGRAAAEGRQLNLDLTAGAAVREKRVKTARRVLSSVLVLEGFGVWDDPARGLPLALDDESGLAAVARLVRHRKQLVFGTSMMEITTCGAIPPYGDLLVGKLVSMLMTSPQVIHDYRECYRDAAVGIRSKTKGEALVRPSELVFLGTCGLYRLGGSQYERIRVPYANGELRFKYVGLTKGHGSVHFSSETRRALETVSIRHLGFRRVNNVSGEGANAKMRLQREGLDTLGLPASLQNHNFHKPVYVIELARNTREYLLGLQERPDYYSPSAADGEAPEVATQAVVEYWMNRWLSSRINNADVLARVSQIEPVAASVGSTDAATLSSPVTAAGGTSGGSPGHGSDGGGAFEPPQPPDPDLSVEFIRRLYRHTALYADRHTEKQLKALHVEDKRLENFVKNKVKDGWSVVLTGNPGDGKTHLLRSLKRSLKLAGAAVQWDASAVSSNRALVDEWRDALARGVPYCIAINEGPLLDLAQEFGHPRSSSAFAPLWEARRQVVESLYYDQEPAPPAHKTLVIDLNRRSLLEPEMVEKVVRRLTDEVFYQQCAACPLKRRCDVPRHRGLLVRPRVLGRLQEVLQLVARTGIHATMRQVHSLISYLVMADRTCEALAATSGRPEQALSYAAYSGVGGLFDAVRQVFDPARVSHPQLDEELWSGTIDATGWDEPRPVLGDLDVEDRAMEQFDQVKRQFFFQHALGEELLKFLPEDVQEYHQHLRQAEAQTQRVVRALIGGINKFFDPASRDDDRLRLWTSHRFDANPTTVLVSHKQVENTKFRLQVPRLAPWLRDALTYQPDHFVLVGQVAPDGGTATLRVDLELYRTLKDAQRGLPLTMRAKEITTRLQAFLDELNRLSSAMRQDIEDVSLRDLTSGEQLRVKVDRINRTYQPG
jgi:hypothetical protein